MKSMEKSSKKIVARYFAVLAVLTLVLGFASSALAESPCIEKGRTYYALMNIPAENFAAKDSDPKLKEEYGKHKAYMGSLAAKGQAVFGGPFKWKKGGGMSILTVGSMEEAKAIAEQDPAKKAGIYNYEIYPWMPVTVTKQCQ